MEIVQTSVYYTYSVLKQDLINLKISYPFLEMGSIGKSVLGRDIWGIKIGNGSKKIFYSASFHAK